MRILHVVATGERRGAELFASSLVGALASEGIEQQVQILRSDGPPTVRFEATTLVADQDGWWVPGIRVRAGAIRSLGEAVRRFAPDVIQTHGGDALKHVLAATRGDGSRVVHRRIGDATQFGGGRIRGWAHAALMRRAVRVITVADVLQAELVERLGVPAAKVVTIPNGVDPSSVEPIRSRPALRRSFGIADDAPVVLSLGALTWEKDPVAHVRIVSAAAADHPGLVHLIAGDGPLRDRLAAEIKREGGADRLRMLGRRDDVGDLLAASDVLLLASRTEGMPACLIEAGMAGLPVAAYGLSGVPEIVVDGETGLLVSPGDEGALAEALSAMLRDPTLRTRLGAAARERCLARFDIAVVAARYLDLYREVASIRAGAPSR